MRKNVALLLVFVFLTASLITAAKPISAATPVENSWTPKAPMHQARYDLGVATVNGKIYAIGGNTETGVVGTNEEYNPTSDTWAFKKSMLTPRGSFATAVYQNKIYCIGGYSNSGTVIGVNEVYDPATDTWETKMPMPTARSNLQANVVNGKIYLIGGIIPDSSIAYGFSFSTFNEVYDPATDSWNTKAPMPTATSSRASVAVDNKVYVIGGLGTEHPGSSLNQIYDPEADVWSLGSTPPLGDGYGAAGATTGFISPSLYSALGTDDVRVYDLEGDTWASCADMPTGRFLFGVANVNDRLYVIGGVTHTYPDLLSRSAGPIVTTQATNEQYTPFGYGTIDPPSSTTPLTEPEPFPTMLVATASVASVAVIGVGLLVYFKKRNH